MIFSLLLCHLMPISIKSTKVDENSLSVFFVCFCSAQELAFLMSSQMTWQCCQLDLSPEDFVVFVKPWKLFWKCPCWREVGGIPFPALAGYWSPPWTIHLQPRRGFTLEEGRELPCNTGWVMQLRVQSSTVFICCAALEHLAGKSLGNILGWGGSNSISAGTEND